MELIKFYVLTVEESTDKKYEFDNEEQVNSFLNDWYQKHENFDDHDEYWIKHIFKGSEFKIHVSPKICVKDKVIDQATFITSKGFKFEKTNKGWKDVTSNLIWKFEDEKDLYTYDNALENFRMNLPTKKEFEQAEEHGFREIINLKKDEWYWSSSLVSLSRNGAWIFSSSSGDVVSNLRNFTYWVRCVERE